jgi:hypothetical protein
VGKASSGRKASSAGLAPIPRGRRLAFREPPNPAPSPDQKKDGSLSGIVEIKAGDKIKIQCDVNNTSSNTLTFRNEVM